ncbi:hypothetical protein FDT66_02685 [Polaribacter aestuariivivens]|uniref:Uncharacterized protein n=1 Tax=Polaribacter aestuariivivens TaxID=2304626 RepID=A0A5S3NAT7_9FLAO|nr:hypothetical protein [Polaribacter aestuariivivens]TMM32390.1 hypothetical protein FDT66_02685 [Polaribacter aestuariivivens]
MQKKFFFLSYILFSLFSFGQKQDSISLKNGIDKPSMLPIHHFGLFSARINQNFKVRTPEKTTVIFSLSSANTFHPFVEMYLPKDEATRNQLREQIWFNRNFYRDQQSTPAEYENIIIDAVFKNFRIDFNTKIAKNHEIGITLRSYLVTKGKYPFSFFTSDETIEWFHSNIAGGEDPFGRKYYGLNQVHVRYQDRNGKKLELKDGQFIFAGIEVNHFYYPNFIKLKKRNISVNFGSHLGINTSKENPSIDFGFSGNIVKKWILKNTNEIRTAFGTAILTRNIINFKENVQLGNNKYLGSFEAMLEYTKYTRKGNYHSISANYQIQTSFSKQDEANYYQLVGKWQEIHSGWQNGFEKLYDYQSAWSWIYTYGRKNYNFSIYLKEDLSLNNSPDVQTGISLKIPISNK